jgi:hypothetical protein
VGKFLAKKKKGRKGKKGKKKWEIVVDLFCN